VKLPDPTAYYADRAVEHTAQGDIYAGIPFVQATRTDPSFQAAGARKRPTGPEPDHSTTVAFTGLAIVLHYTCGFTAQPPGTRGYSHEYRLMAPVVSLRELRRWGIGNNELRKIRDGGTIQGFMYLPQAGTVVLDGPGGDGDEWTGPLPRCSIARLPSRNPCWTTSLGSRASQPTRRGSSTRRSSRRTRRTTSRGSRSPPPT